MATKSEYYQALKSAGVDMSAKHFAQYGEDELRAAYILLQKDQIDHGVVPDLPLEVDDITSGDDRSFSTVRELQQTSRPLLAEEPVDEMPGQRLNTLAEDEVLFVDDQGRSWYQKEVLKPGFARPRGRRVLQYSDTGTTTETVQNGEYVETFEVAGEGRARVSEIKVTLPSYQTGIYKDPRYPFKVHTYNGKEGFDLVDVANYYGGSDLVPEAVKRIYIENVLCYDIRTTIRAIQDEHRQLVLAGKVTP